MIINKKSTQLQKHTKKTHMVTNMWYIDITNTKKKHTKYNKYMKYKNKY